MSRILLAALVLSLAYPLVGAAVDRSIAMNGDDAAVWTDGNGDGLPDTEALMVEQGDVVAVDVWLNTRDFEFDEFRLWIYRTSECTQFQTGEFVIDGGTLSFDEVSCPGMVGVIGVDVPVQSGTKRIATLYWSAVDYGECGLYPAIPPIDMCPWFCTVSGPEGTFVQVTDVDGTDWIADPANASDVTSWGRVKQLFR